MDFKTPFLENAKKGVGCARMTENCAEEYIMAVMLESSGKSPTMEELREKNIFSIEVIMKRIEAFKLPIKFTTTGLIAAYAMVENNPGRAIILLIDCLTKWEGKTISASMLADIYPFGFYDENTIIQYIDNYLKNPEHRSKIKWAHIY